MNIAVKTICFKDLTLISRKTYMRKSHYTPKECSSSVRDRLNYAQEQHLNILSFSSMSFWMEFHDIAYAY